MRSSSSRRAALASLTLAVAVPAASSIHAEPVAAVVVTATRNPQPVADVISDTVTIDAAQIAQSGAGSIIDLLQRQRGIEVARNGGAGTSASVYIRGANSNQNIVLVDGVRIGSSTTGAANWSAIPLTAIDHIEIVYGPLSSLYGADAVGGVIQIFTKTGRGAPAVTAFAGAGSDQTHEFDASVSGATGGEHSFSYAFSAGTETSNGFSATRPGSSSYNADRDGYDKSNLAAQLRRQRNRRARAAQQIERAVRQWRQRLRRAQRSGADQHGHLRQGAPAAILDQHAAIRRSAGQGRQLFERRRFRLLAHRQHPERPQLAKRRAGRRRRTATAVRPPRRRSDDQRRGHLEP